MEQRRILCFGDSLTDGYVATNGSGVLKRPYAVYLEAAIGDNNFQTTVEHSGVCGETTREMLTRFKLELMHDEAQAANRFGMICILAGTNDLGTQVPVEEVFENLKNLCSMALAHRHNMQVCLMTVPENGCDLQWLDRERQRLNALLREFVDEKSKTACVTLFDLEKAVPNNSQTTKLWSDTLHMSALGYKMLAAALFSHLIEAKFIE